MNFKSNRIVFIYQNAFSQTGGIQTFNKYFINALEEITQTAPSTEVSLVSIYDRAKDIKTSLPALTLNDSKLKAFRYILEHSNHFDTFIFAHVNLAPLAVLLHTLNSKAKIIFCTHGIEIWKKLPYFTEWIMNRSTILTVSSFSKSELLRHNSALPDVRIFPNCIKTKKDIEVHPNPYNTANFNLLSITRLSASEKLKGIDSILKSLPLLIKTIPNIKYTVIGKGEDVERLQHLAHSLNVSSHVDFLGFVEDINAYYQHCDLFTLPSKKEGFGIVYLEAMQYKKPVLAVNYGGPTDVIVDSETGYLCEYDDVQCLAEKIKMLYTDPSHSKVLGDAGYERLMDNFTFEHFALNLRTVLLEN